MSTYQPRTEDVERAWLVIDAENLVLGRLATEIATILRGKHKPIWAPHVDCGDHVIVVNAAKVAVTGAKRADKTYWRHSGYPGGIRSRSLEEMLERHPDRVVRLAVRGMLPKNRLGRRILKKLHVYAGPDHPHSAQKPETYEPRAASRARD